MDPLIFKCVEASSRNAAAKVAEKHKVVEAGKEKETTLYHDCIRLEYCAVFELEKADSTASHPKGRLEITSHDLLPYVSGERYSLTLASVAPPEAKPAKKSTK